MLTFTDEVKYIWIGGRWDYVRVLFLLNRYMNEAGLLYTAYSKWPILVCFPDKPNITTFSIQWLAFTTGSTGKVLIDLKNSDVSDYVLEVCQLFYLQMNRRDMSVPPDV